MIPSICAPLVVGRLDEVRQAEVDVRLQLNLAPLSFLDAAAEGGLRRSRRQVGMGADYGEAGEICEDVPEAAAPRAPVAAGMGGGSGGGDDEESSSESSSSEDEDDEDEDGGSLVRRRKAKRRVMARVELSQEEIMMR